MSDQREWWSRRQFVGRLTLTGTAGLLGVLPVAAEPAPETTTLRIDQRPSICAAPQYVAEELLRGVMRCWTNTSAKTRGTCREQRRESLRRITVALRSCAVANSLAWTTASSTRRETNPGQP